MTRFQLLHNCICIQPCTKKCDVCGLTLCEMTRQWKNACAGCAEWFFTEFHYLTKQFTFKYRFR